ncbi:MAG TPA: POTRA domain-containing protein, partial [Gemmatimonadaceae bacterium]
MPQPRETPSRRRGAVVGAILGLSLVAATSSARAQDLSCGTGDVEVRSLQFEGNKAISDDELSLRVTTTPSSTLRSKLHLPFGAKRCLNRSYIPLDLAKLEIYYLERGYYSAQIDTVITPISRSAVRVVFRIKEGPVTKLRVYQVTGLSGIADSAPIVRSLRLRQGGPYDRGLLFADLDSIKVHLRNSGYYRAETFTRTNRVDSTLSATVEVNVEPGVRARFGTPQFHVTPLDNRVQQVPNSVVQRVAAISPGSFYSDRAITEAQRNLFQLNIYRHVEVQPLPDSLQPPGDSVVVLDYRLSEDYMRRLDWEPGLATLDCGHVRGQYTDQNFLHSARRLELTGQASKIGYGAPLETSGTRGFCNFIGQNALTQDSASSRLHYFTGVSYRQPRLLGTHWVPTVSVYSERRGEYKAYLRSTEVGTDLSATRDVADRTQLRLGYTQEFGRTEAPDAVLCSVFSRCDEASRLDISKLATLGVVSANVTRLRTNDLVNPTRGSILRAEL